MVHKNSYTQPLPKLELDKNRRRVKHCPCGKSNKDGKFVPFKGYDDKGYCHSCGKTFLPDLPNNVIHWHSVYINKTKNEKKLSRTVSYIFTETLEESLTDYYKNNFVLFLVELFGVDLADELVNNYHIGTSGLWYGANIFWQIDYEGKIRTGKIMLYNARTGKRVKKPFSHISWAHLSAATDGNTKFNLQQCFFGEHLLNGCTKPVAIVESEKTAVIASAYLPQFVWLATGSMTNLKAEKCRVLKGRHVVLFPDLNAFESWSRKANELEELYPDTRFDVSNLLEQKASPQEKYNGLDLADYLVKLNEKDFNREMPKSIRSESKYAGLPQEQVLPVLQKEEYGNKYRNGFEMDTETKGYFKLSDSTNTFISSKEKRLSELETENRRTETEALRTFFAGKELPASFRLNSWSIIHNVPVFIESHLAAMVTYKGNSLYNTYHLSLVSFKDSFSRSISTG